MPYVYLLQERLNRYKLGRSTTVIKSEGPVVWSLETNYDHVCDLLLRKKLEKHACIDNSECYEVPSQLLSQYIDEIQASFQTYTHAEEQSQVFAKRDSSSTMLPASMEACQLYVQLDNVRKKLALLECEKVFLENKIKALIGDCAGIQGIATWKTSTTRRLDSDVVKNHFPDVYQSCIKETKSRRFCFQSKNSN